MILFMISCQSTETENFINIKNRYTISIPSFLTEVNSLNENASLQYQHVWKEFYVIVIDESIEECNKALVDNNITNRYSNGIDGYCKFALEGLKQSMSTYNKFDVIKTVINKMPARLLTITGRVEGVDVFFYLGFIEGRDRYYQVMAWTLANKEYKYKEKMRTLIYSLNEL